MSVGRGPNPPDAEDEDPTWRTYVLDLVSSASAVALFGLMLFAVSGVWPPLVAIESPSMSPHIHTGDLVFVMEGDRFPGPGHHGATGVVTAEAGERTGYAKFQGPGDVIVFAPNGNADQTPIIHRAMFWVDRGENWCAKADPRYLGGASSGERTDACEADHAGFVTKGDANGKYDQVDAGISSVVRPSWVVGTAEARVPALGHVRLQTGNVAASGPTTTEQVTAASHAGRSSPRSASAAAGAPPPGGANASTARTPSAANQSADA